MSPSGDVSSVREGMLSDQCSMFRAVSQCQEHKVLKILIGFKKLTFSQHVKPFFLTTKQLFAKILSFSLGMLCLKVDIFPDK